MRTGLFSEPLVIDRLNQSFVCTWILVDVAQQRAKEGDQFAQTLADNWKFPMDIMFLSDEGQLMSKLNSFRDLNAAHPDVGHPGAERGRTAPHLKVFLDHLNTHFKASVDEPREPEKPAPPDVPRGT